jgi:hypothetical protein
MDWEGRRKLGEVRELKGWGLKAIGKATVN